MSSSSPSLPSAWGTWGGWALQSVDSLLLQSLRNGQRNPGPVHISLPPAARAFIEGEFGEPRRRRRQHSLDHVFSKLSCEYEPPLAAIKLNVRFLFQITTTPS